MTDDTPITRFALMRHALTEWNKVKQIQGQTDTPLSPEGLLQASGWGRRLAEGNGRIRTLNRILSSDLQRAQKTTGLVNQYMELPVHTDRRLREQDWGDWVGLTTRALYRDFPDLVAEQEASGWGFRPPGGESRREVLQRGRETLDDAARRWPGQTLLIVTHGGMMKCLLYHLLERMFVPTESSLIRAYHLHWLSLREGELKLDGLNALPLDQVSDSESSVTP